MAVLLDNSSHPLSPPSPDEHSQYAANSSVHYYPIMRRYGDDEAVTIGRGMANGKMKTLDLYANCIADDGCSSRRPPPGG